MRKINFIDIHSIKMDRHPLNKSTLSLIKYMENGGFIPPIKVARLKQGGYLIRDGRHRVTASKILGRKSIEAKFSDVPLRS
jgi:ParB-like chromosome segregation protein Spo0J